VSAEQVNELKRWVAELGRQTTAGGGDESLKLSRVADIVSKNFGVQLHEVALMLITPDDRFLRFVLPPMLRNVGQVPLTSGKIRFAGSDISYSPSFRRARAGIGYVPQGRQIFPSLSVYENLRMGFVENGVDSEENVIKDVLARFPRLDPIIDRIGSALSGGEQQILALARCLCGSPKLLLLDEPTEGIQPSIVEEILEILIGLHRYNGLAIIVVEQSLDFIRRLSERVLLIERGTITGEVLPEALGHSKELGSYIAAE